MTPSLLIALLLGTIPGNAPAKATATAVQIEKLTLDGKAQDAVERGRSAVNAHPDDVDLRLALARALAATSRHVKRQVNVFLSQKDVENGEVAVPGAELENAPSQVDYDPGPFEEANLHLDFAIGHAPKRRDLRVFQCFLLTDAGRIDRAKAAIAGALQALPRTHDLAITMAAYGAERTKRNDPAGGAALLATVAEAFPKEPAVLVDYANVLTRLGRKDEAFATFDRVTALAPGEASYARTKAVGAMLLREYLRARKAFDAAFRIGRGVADQFASYVADYGLDPAGAAKSMQDPVVSGPAADPSVSGLAGQFIRAARRGPASVDAMSLARSLAAAEQYLFEIPVLDRALAADPKNAEARTMLKDAYRALGCATLAP